MPIELIFVIVYFYLYVYTDMYDICIYVYIHMHEFRGQIRCQRLVEILKSQLTIQFTMYSAYRADSCECLFIYVYTDMYNICIYVYIHICTTHVQAFRADFWEQLYVRINIYMYICVYTYQLPGQIPNQSHLEILKSQLYSHCTQ